MSVDYSQALTESARDQCWKTANNVSPTDINRVTHRLRYQAEQLGLRITVHTDRHNRTVSFLTRALVQRSQHAPD
jgi:hypothetical protein